MRLKPRKYNYKQTEELKGMTLPKGENMGFIAQELEEVFPNLIKNSVNPAMPDEHGKVLYPEVSFKAVDYISLIPVLTAGIQEQQTIIEQQNAKISQIESELARLKESNINAKNNAETSTKVVKQSIHLSADPNPFQKETKISYDMSESSYNVAQLRLTNSNGVEIRKITLSNAKGDYVINGSDLSTTGVYYVYLMVDNNIADVIKIVFLN